MSTIDGNLKHGKVTPFPVATTFLTLVSLALLVATDVALAGRFTGGVFDGYDSSKYLQPSYGNNRFKGGTYDGFDTNTLANHTIPDCPRLTFIFF